ncbi:nickel import ATP-binding protein NikD [Niallia sp. 03133]|uniref:nickel import ATP-binding protein NikD n=1 Tax=Niallia sp. 03133 TaxID=3458060 RepID=UPI00404441E2
MSRLIEKQPNVLQVSGLRVNARTVDGLVPLVQGVDFELKHGRILGIVGESGSGKTITCLSLLQLFDHKTMSVEGSIKLHGRELNELGADERRKIRGKEMAFIMQNPMNAFTPVHTIGSHFMETIRTHTPLTKKQAWELAIDSMEDLNLPNPSDLMRRYPFQLSGGMLQRVMIAISLCLQPSIIIADEPTTALDVDNQLQVLRLLNSIRAKYGASILLISHDLGVIAELADDVAVMKNGRIVEKAEVYQLFDHPKHEYTKKLLKANAAFHLSHS